MKTKYIDIIKGLEGFRAVPYKCSAGVLTVGYGHSERLDDLALTNPTLTETLEWLLGSFLSSKQKALKLETR